MRIEDLAIVRDDGVELLTSFPKELIEVREPNLVRTANQFASRYTPAPMAEVVSTNQFRNGMHIELDGQTWRIVEFQHVKPGKGGAFVRTKLKSLRLRSGRRQDVPGRREVRARPHRARRTCSTSTTPGDEVVFMDESTYEQLSLPHAADRGRAAVHAAVVLGAGDVRRRDAPPGIDLPASVVLEVTDTEPGVKGDTVSNVTKPATLETGAVVQVPLFVNVGDKIKVDPREKRYIQRA